jgi:hypothetical protein
MVKEWRDNGQGKEFERLAHVLLQQAEGDLKLNYFLKFTKRGFRRKLEFDAVLVTDTIVYLFEIKSMCYDPSEDTFHKYLGKFKNTCYLLENEEKVLADETPDELYYCELQEMLNIKPHHKYARAVIVPHNKITEAKIYNHSHKPKRKGVFVEVITPDDILYFIGKIHRHHNPSRL